MNNLNDHNNTPLSNINIGEVVLRFMREVEEESITDANNFTADAYSIAFSPHREISNVIFASEKLENSDGLVNAVSNMTINDV